MTVYVRGYRPYEGRLGVRHGGGFPALAIAREGIVTAWRRKSFKWIGVFYLIWFAFMSFVLYMAAGAAIPGLVSRMLGQHPMAAPGGDVILQVLNILLRIFYWGVGFLTALFAIFAGAPLISDDLGARAFSLYLARPIRSSDYVIGKLLVLPALLSVALVLPGVMFYVLAGVWHPAGQSWEFLFSHLEVLERIGEHWLLTSAAYTGLMLLLSSRTSRRGLAAIAAGAAVFGGVLAQGVGLHLRHSGPLADLLGVVNLPRSLTAIFSRAEGVHVWHPQNLPAQRDVRILAATLLVLGAVAVWRRVRTVEVTS